MRGRLSGLMFHHQNNGIKPLRDNRALFAAENAESSRTKEDDEGRERVQISEFGFKTNESKQRIP
jgi:hypothetical protein